MLTANNVSIGFHNEALLENVEIAIEPGNMLVVRGANGLGKSSLLSALAGLSIPLSGQVKLFDEPIENYLHSRQILMLGHELGLTPELTLLEQVKRLQLYYGIHESLNLTKFYLTGLEELSVSSLSAGQKRRLWLSILDQFRGKLLLLDEPFLALDKDARVMLEMILERFISEHQGIVVVATHLHEKVKFCSQELELSMYLPQD